MDCIFLTGSSLQNGKGELEGGSPGVVLLSVTKEHDRHKAGVWDLTLTFHRDQITALLGTNGAGKTTVMCVPLPFSRLPSRALVLRDVFTCEIGAGSLFCLFIFV